MNIKSIIMIMALFISASTANSQTSPVNSANVIKALEEAMKHPKLAPNADKVKLYTASCSSTSKRTSYTFTFFDGGDMLHTLTLSPKRDPYFSSRQLGRTRLFKELDVSKLPAPKDVVMKDLVVMTKKMLTALELGPDTQKTYINYSLTNSYKEKTKSIHRWTATVLVEEGSRSMMVGFRDGKFTSMTESSIKK